MLLQEYYPQDVRVRKEVGALVEAGHNISIFCLRKNGQAETEEIGIVKIFRTNLSKERGSKLRYVYEYVYFFMVSYFFLRKYRKKNKIDILYVHTLPDFLVFAGKFLKKSGTKIVLDLHEIMPEFYCSKFGLHENHFIIKILKWLERRSIELADQVITVNESIKELFLSRSKPKNPIAVIMNTCNEETHIKKEKISTDKFIAVYHGSITSTYSLSFAIKAIAGIKEQLPYFEFRIYGNGNEVELLKNFVKDLKLQDIVKVMGEVSQELIPEILAGAKLGILPMKKDIMLDLSFSNKLAEYVHYGIPVISTRLKAVERYFSDDALTYFESGNEQDFQNKLLNIYGNYTDAVQKADVATKIYENLSWDEMKKRLVTTINNIK